MLVFAFSAAFGGYPSVVLTLQMEVSVIQTATRAIVVMQLKDSCWPHYIEVQFLLFPYAIMNIYLYFFNIFTIWKYYYRYTAFLDGSKNYKVIWEYEAPLRNILILFLQELLYPSIWVQYTEFNLNVNISLIQKAFVSFPFYTWIIH